LQLLPVQAVGIGDIGNELFYESMCGARSLHQVELEGALKLLGSTHFVLFELVPRFRPIAPPPLGNHVTA
jgi:hypothetical protein